MKKSAFLLLLTFILTSTTSLFGANRFWVGGAGNWSDNANHWSATSGGAPGAAIPGAGDDAIFDANSGLAAATIVVINQNISIRTLNFSAVAASFVFNNAATHTIDLTGSLLSNAAGVTFTGTWGNVEFNPAILSTNTITSGGTSWVQNFVFNPALLSSYTMSDDFSTSGNITLSGGDIDMNGQDLTCAQFSTGAGLSGRVLDISNSTVTVSNGVWNIAQAMTLTSTNSTILMGDVAGIANFTGGDADYDTVRTLAATIFNYADDNTFTLVELQPSSTLSIANGDDLETDSLVLYGACGAQALITEASAGANGGIRKTGYNVLTLASVDVIGVNALGAPTYELIAGSQTGSTGWDVYDNQFYWIGNSGNWTDPAHWSFTSGGPSAGCIPTSADTVFFDANSFSLANQTVLVNDSAFFRAMDWTGITAAQALVLDSSMFASGDVTLHANLSLTRNVNYSGIFFDETAALDGANAALIDCNFLIAMNLTASSLTLAEDLVATDSSNILLFQGGFNTGNNDVKLGSIKSINDPSSGSDTRSITMGSSTIELSSEFNALGDTILVINSGTSNLVIADSSNYPNSLITTGNKTFYNVQLYFAPLQNQKQLVAGNNTFNIFEILAGSEVYLDSNATQTVNDSLLFRGNCRDSIFLSTMDAGLTDVAILDMNGTAAEIDVTCLVVSGINASGLAIPAYFSTNGGSNTNITFPVTPAVNPAFMPDSTLSSFCFGDTVHFQNNSLPYNGTFNDLIFEWYVSDGSLPLTDATAIIEAEKLAATLNFPDTLGISKSEYLNVTGWTEILDPQGIFNPATSQATTTAGYEGMRYEFTVGYRMILNNATGSDAYLVDMDASASTVLYGYQPKVKILKNGIDVGVNSSQFAFPTHNFTEGTLSNGTTQIGSDTVSFILNATDLTTADLLSIQMGSNVSYAGFSTQPRWKDANLPAGNDVNISYRIEIDTIHIEAVPINPTYQLDTLVHEFQTFGDSILVTLNAIDTRNYCEAKDTFYINITKPNVSLITSETDLTLCPWQTVTHEAFSVYDSTQFEFFLNGVSQNTPSVNDTLYSSFTLSDQDTVGVLAYYGGCVSDTMPHFIYTVNPAPTFSWASSDADTSICQGDLVSFSTGTNPNKYSYKVNAAFVTGFIASGNYSTSALNDNDIVTIIVRDSVTLCRDTAFMQFNVDPLPTTVLAHSAGGNVICQGTSVTFTGSGAAQYEFFVNGVSVQGPSATTTCVIDTLENSDIVTVVGISATGCEKQALESYSYIVLPSPATSLTVSDIDSTICSGTTVTFGAANASTYEFFINGTSVQGPSASNSYITNSLSDSDTIVVVGTFSGCSAPSSEVIMTVNATPATVLTDDDADNSICAGTLVNFTGSGATNYEFFVNGVSQGASSPTNTFSTSALTNGQIVSVVGESNGCTFSQQQGFAVLNNPNVLQFSNDVDNIICQNGSITFTGAGAALYEFFVNGVSVQGPTSTSTLVNPSLNVGLDTVFVIGTAANGCTDDSPIIEVTVNPTPTIVASSSDIDNTICAGQSVTFTGTGGSMYQFLLNGVPQGVMSPTSTFTTSSLTNGATLQINGTLAGCPSSSNTIVTTVNAIPTTVLGSSDIDNIYCESTVVTYTASGATNYEFILNGSSQGPSSPTNTINSSGFAPGPYTLQVIGESNNCSSSAQVNITVNGDPTVALGSSDIDNTICAGDAVTYTGAGASLYEFFVNGSSQGAVSSNPNLVINSLVDGDVVSVVGYTPQGCNDNDALTAITVNPIPAVTLNSSDIDQTICIGDNVDFTAGGATNYEFFVNGVSQGPASGVNTFSTTSLSNNDVIVVNGESLGCATNSTTIQFNVYGPPVVSLVNNGDTQICVGEATDLLAGGAGTYQFLVNGVPAGPFSPANNFTTPVNDGDVLTVVGESNGCFNNSLGSVTYTVYAYPTLSSSSSDLDNIICLDDMISFTASGGMTYDFQLNSSSLQNGVTSTYDINSLVDGDQVSIIAYNGDCPSTADNYIFTVNSMNLDLAVAASSMICEGENVVFTASGGDEYEFFLNGTSTGALSPVNIYSNATLNDGDEVSFTAFSTSTLCTQNYSDYVIMNVMTEPVANPLDFTTFCDGDSVVLVSNQAYGNQWFLDGSPIPGATDTFYVATTSGNYSLGSTMGGNGTMWSFGHNANGMFADGTNANNADPTVSTSTQTFDEISSGSGFLLGVTTTGEVYAWGDNGSGQLGQGTFTASNAAIQVPTLANIKTVATAEASAMAVTNTGGVYVWGNNTQGQLATGNTSVINFPFLNPALTAVDTIAAGRRHYVILRNDGTVWTVGNNSYGQLGQGNLTPSMNAIQVAGLANIVSVGAGEYQSYAIDNTGDLYVWGNNGSGQLGLNDLTNRLVPTPAPLKNVINAQGGATHSVFLTSEKKVFTSGGNTYGQLGTGNFTASQVAQEVAISGAEMISAGQYTTLVKRADNSVFGFGNNTEDQLSSTSGLTVATPEHIQDLDGVGYIEAGWIASHVLFTEATTCTSADVAVTVNPTPTPTITATGATLSTIAGASYQWYFNGLPIPGATSQTYVANTGGNYYVEVTSAAGCTGASPVYTVSLAGVDDLTATSLLLYPNPTNAAITVELPSSFDLNAAAQIYDAAGRLVQNLNFDNASSMTIEVYDLEPGIYTFVVRSGAVTAQSRFTVVR